MEYSFWSIHRLSYIPLSNICIIRIISENIPYLELAQLILSALFLDELFGIRRKQIWLAGLRNCGNYGL